MTIHAFVKRGLQIAREHVPDGGGLLEESSTLRLSSSVIKSQLWEIGNG